MRELRKIFLKTFGYMSVADTQIAIYKKTKRLEPEWSEDDVLNYLINTRLKSIPRIASKKEEYFHCQSLLKNPRKTIEDVIWEIIYYEYFESREDSLKRKAPAESLEKAKEEARRYIKEKVSELKSNL